MEIISEKMKTNKALLTGYIQGEKVWIDWHDEWKLEDYE